MKSLVNRNFLISAVFGLAATAVSADPPLRPKIDSNGDGVVDFVEMQEVHPDLTVDQFNKMDSNRDGQLVPEELHAAFTAKMIKRMDSDGDGAVTRAEMKAAGPRHPDADDRFTQFDSDGDGKLSQAELAAMHEAMRKQFETMGKQPGHRPPWDESN